MLGSLALTRKNKAHSPSLKSGVRFTKGFIISLTKS